MCALDIVREINRWSAEPMDEEQVGLVAQLLGEATGTENEWVLTQIVVADPPDLVKAGSTG